jgi:hypothetical protein
MAALRTIVYLLAICCGAANAAQDLPVTMVLSGQIAAGAAAARAGDQVLVFSAVDGQLVGSGPVQAQGGYGAILTRSASFNGSPLVFELLQGNRRYALLPEGVAPPLRFRGKLLPERSTLELRVGVKTADLSAGEVENLQAQRLSRRPELPCMPELDVDGDGKCDARDWDILRLYGGGMSRSVAHPD